VVSFAFYLFDPYPSCLGKLWRAAKATMALMASRGVSVSWNIAGLCYSSYPLADFPFFSFYNPFLFDLR
jgi:hypothetical protein